MVYFNNQYKVNILVIIENIYFKNLKSMLYIYSKKEYYNINKYIDILIFN